MPSHRAEQLDQLAFHLNMAFTPQDTWGLISLLSDFKLFRRGFGKRITNILYQQSPLLNTDIRVFDYRYTISTGNSARRFRQSVFFIHSRQLALPEFYMKPENILHQIGALLGFEDIDFENAPKFSQNYWLRGSDEDYIRASFPDSFLHFFRVEKNWHLEGLNYYLIFYRKNHLIPPHKVKDFYEKGMKVFEMLAEKAD